MGFLRRLINPYYDVVERRQVQNSMPPHVNNATNAGKPQDVWFSRNIMQQELQHFMIVVKFHKLELVRTSTDSFQLQHTYYHGWTPDLEKANFVHLRGQRAHGGYDGWSMCRMGYCQTPDAQTEAYIQSLLAQHPPHVVLTWEQAQQFLSQVASAVVQTRDAQFWHFFEMNTDLRRRHVSQLPVPEEMGITAESLSRGATNSQTSMASMDRLNRMQNSMIASQQQTYYTNAAPGYGI